MLLTYSVSCFWPTTHCSSVLTTIDSWELFTSLCRCLAFALSSPSDPLRGEYFNCLNPEILIFGPTEAFWIFPYNPGRFVGLLTSSAPLGTNDSPILSYQRLPVSEKLGSKPCASYLPRCSNSSTLLISVTDPGLLCFFAEFLTTTLRVLEHFLNVKL